MKCIKCHNTMDMETGEFSMNIDGKTVNVINAPIVHCKYDKEAIDCSITHLTEKLKQFLLYGLIEPLICA